MRLHLRRLAQAAGFLAAFALAGAASAQVTLRPITGDPVQVTGGRVAGTVLDSGVKAYLGIPFAAPPIRDLRWREPHPVVPWRGVRSAATPPPACVQTMRSPGGNMYAGPEAISEDCLYLNLWAPADAKPGAKLPVIMWIYGGGFSSGSASQLRDRGENLARKGVIYVAGNYRVGALGFMAHPELTAESPHHASGGYGFLDQLAVLKWIQANIARFGGDPDNVTVMGHSAGSVSASALHASPLAKGLFKKVMGVSASALTWEAGYVIPHEQAEQTGLEVQKALGGKSIAEMRLMAPDRVSQMRVGPPSVDGWFLPKNPIDIFAAGEQNDVTTFVGFTRDEGYGPFVSAATPDAYEAAARRLYGDGAAAKLLQLYPATGADWRRTAQLASRDITLGTAMRRWLMGQASPARQPAYGYLFARRHTYAPGATFTDHDPATAGAFHGSDPAYWLNNLEAYNAVRPTRAWTAWDRELADKMSDMVVAFARTGNPSIPGVTVPRYDRADERLVQLGDAISIVPFPARENVAFLHGLKAAPNPPANPAPR